jgi:plastocyanin
MRKMIVLVGLIALAAGGCARNGQRDIATSEPLSSAPRATASAAPSAADCVDRSAGASAAIEQQDFKFVPDCVVMTTSQGFSIRNAGSVLHNFSVEGVAGIDLDIQPGQTNNTENPGLDADVYTFFCKYHRDRGMEGELRIRSG